MAEQNIYDNQLFFDRYKKLRENPKSANVMIEKPALYSICPSFKGKKILDLGCGYGENCRYMSELGAEQVIGIDISQKMLDVAIQENSLPNIQYLQKSMNEISSLHQKFDLIISSLAVHYIEDFDKLVTNIYDCLNSNGTFIFSQEHPISTGLKDENHWTIDNEGNILHFNLTNYGIEGFRQTNWIIEDVIKYHRTFSSIINSLIHAGFKIVEIIEPLPDEEIIKKYPSYKKSLDKPDFLIVHVQKP